MLGPWAGYGAEDQGRREDSWCAAALSGAFAVDVRLGLIYLR